MYFSRKHYNDQIKLRRYRKSTCTGVMFWLHLNFNKSTLFSCKISLVEYQFNRTFEVFSIWKYSRTGVNSVKDNAMKNSCLSQLIDKEI